MNLSLLLSCRLRLIPCVVAVLFALGSASARAQHPTRPSLTFEDLLTQMSSGPADPCGGGGEDYSDSEFHLFIRADDAVVQALNGTSTASPESRDLYLSETRTRALEALAALEGLSTRVNQDWPDDKRFHFEVLDVAPALVVKMTYRNRARFSLFAVPELDDRNKANTLWKSFSAADDGSSEPKGGYDWLDLLSLQRGPSNRPRFLAKFGDAGCGSGVGTTYYAYEWDADNFGEVTQLVKLQGAVNLEEPVEKGRSSGKGLSNSFPPIGELRTDGPLISLPYCWFSAIDTWDNPSLCAVDSFDVSGDNVRFVGRITNRPDLVPVAKVIEYGQTHDYPAVLAYCASPQVARQIVRDVPPFVFAGDLKITRVDDKKERVEIGVEKVFRVDVEKRGRRWLVASWDVVEVQ